MVESAFQANAFQNNAFQIVSEEPTPPSVGVSRPLPPKRGRSVQQDDEEVLMVVLSAWTVINQRRH
jgi:hypothetical protein